MFSDKKSYAENNSPNKLLIENDDGHKRDRKNHK